MNKLTFLNNKLSRANVRLVTNDRRTKTLNLRIVEVISKSTHWAVDYVWVPTIDGASQALVSHYRTNRGKNILIPMPQPENITINAPGSTLQSNAAVDATSITIAFTGAYQVDNGAYFTVGTDPKVYQVTQSRSSTSSGNVSFNIFPSLLRSQSAGATVNFSPNLRGRYVNPNQNQDDQGGKIHRVSFTVEESL